MSIYSNTCHFQELEVGPNILRISKLIVDLKMEGLIDSFPTQPTTQQVADGKMELFIYFVFQTIIIHNVIVRQCNEIWNKFNLCKVY